MNKPKLMFVLLFYNHFKTSMSNSGVFGTKGKLISQVAVQNIRGLKESKKCDSSAFDGHEYVDDMNMVGHMPDDLMCFNQNIWFYFPLQKKIPKRSHGISDKFFCISDVFFLWSEMISLRLWVKPAPNRLILFCSQ